LATNVTNVHELGEDRGQGATNDTNVHEWVYWWPRMTRIYTNWGRTEGRGGRAEVGGWLFDGARLGRGRRQKIFSRKMKRENL